MGIWAFYFFAKIFLHFRGHLQIHFVCNLLLAGYFCLPIPKGASRPLLLARLKLALGCLSAFLLLWYDSFLPPLLFTLNFARGAATMISGRYILMFFDGYFNPWDAAALVEIFVVCLALRKRPILAPAVFLGLLLIPIRGLGHHESDELAADVARFYQTQARQIVKFPAARSGPDFDVVLIHVCSLSWDDLKVAGFDQDPFLGRFNLLFTGYNSVSTYSGPAAIRLLRSPCGQLPQKGLYQSAPGDCYLLDDLRGLGYSTYSAWDHPGDFDVWGPWKDQVRIYGHADPTQDNTGLFVPQYNFDNEPIADNYAVLERWWRTRQASKAPRAALFFNTAMLHGGVHWASDTDWWKRDRTEQYKESLTQLFRDMDRFFDLVASSGRNVVVILVPEHGRNLEGSVMQAPDYREIPLPEVTLVPLAVKLIGRRAPAPRKPAVVVERTSLQAVAYLLSSFLAHSPFEGAGISPEVVNGIPEVPFVSENEEVKVAEKGGAYYYFGKDKQWTAVPTKALSLRAIPYLGKRLLSWLEHRSLTDLAEASAKPGGAKVIVNDDMRARVFVEKDKTWAPAPSDHSRRALDSDRAP